MNMQEAFDKLSPEEISLLNSDPQMLNDFKAKYGGEPSLASKMYEKAKSISPELVNPMNLIPQVAGYKLGNTLLEKVGEGYEKMGDVAAEAVDKGGKHPYLSAAIGGTIKNIPNAVMAAQALESTPELAQGAGNLAKFLKGASSKSGEVISENVDRLRNMARILTGPGEATQTVAMQPIRNAATGFVDEAQSALQTAKQIPPELTQAKAELPELQSRMARLGGERQALIAKAGKNIQSLESGLGNLDSAKIQQLVSDQNVRQATLKDLTSLASQGPEAVNAKMTARDIQQMRQFVQEVARNPELTIEAPQAQQINNVLGQAMDKHIPGYKDALDLYKTAQEALADVPNIKAQQLGQLRSRIKDMGDAFTNSKLGAADALKKAQVNAKQIMQKADMMVQQGKLSDVYRQRLYKGIIATGILGGATKLAHVLGGQ
jgi:hypothetical protein